MTISSTAFKNQHVGNGSNTVFAYTFKIFGENDIAVLEGDTTKVITTDYTVSGAGSDSGGNITFVTAPANGVVVTIKRAEPLTQDIDYTENDDFPAQAHEEGLDRSVIRDQTLQEKLDRALVLSEGSTVSGITFPDPTGNAEKFVRVNATADNFEYLDIASSGDLAVSAFAETLLDDADASEARTTLGLGTAATTDSGDYATAAQGTLADDAQPDLSGASLTSATVAPDDKVLVQDTSDSNNLKTVTAQSIADLSAPVAAAGAQFKVGATTHNLASATGTIVITGVGFQPTVIDMLINLDASDNFSTGFSDASLGRCVTRHAGSYIAGASLGSIYTGGVGNRVDFALTAFSADGFTITYTKFGSPSGLVALSYKVAR